MPATSIMRGPYFSLAEYQHGVTCRPIGFSQPRLSQLGRRRSFPAPARMPTASACSSNCGLIRGWTHPAETGCSCRCARLHTTDNKSMFDFNLAHPTGRSAGAHRCLVQPVESRLREPYAYAKTSEVIPWLQERRRRQIRLTSSAFYGLPAEWAADPGTLPCQHPRIAFRDVGTRYRLADHDLSPLSQAMSSSSTRPPTFSSVAVTREMRPTCSASCLHPARLVRTAGSSKSICRSAPQRVPDPTAGRERSAAAAGRRDSRPVGCGGRPLRDWAAEVGVPVGSVTDEATKDDLIAELDALVAHLYGLGRSDVEHIFATFHRGWDYAARLAAVLAHYDRWAATPREDGGQVTGPSRETPISARRSPRTGRAQERPSQTR